MPESLQIFRFSFVTCMTLNCDTYALQSDLQKFPFNLYIKMQKMRLLYNDSLVTCILQKKLHAVILWKVYGMSPLLLIDHLTNDFYGILLLLLSLINVHIN